MQSLHGAMSKPLAGIKVVEFGQNLAGPYCGQILAFLGAGPAFPDGHPYRQLVAAPVVEDRPEVAGYNPINEPADESGEARYTAVGGVSRLAVRSRYSSSMMAAIAPVSLADFRMESTARIFLRRSMLRCRSSHSASFSSFVVVIAIVSRTV